MLLNGPVLMFYALGMFVNGLTLLGLVKRETTWPFHYAIAGVAFLCSFALGILNAMGPHTGIVVTLNMIFALDYLLNGLEITRGIDAKVHGYFCIFGTVLLALMAINFYTLGWLTFTFCAVVWTLLSFMFASIILFQVQWVKTAGYICLAGSFVTLFVPAYLMILNKQIP